MMPLYRRLLGADFEALPAAVRRLHDLDGEARWSGFADVERGRHPLARGLASLLRLPAEGKAQPLTVTFTPRDGTEVWTRQFGSRRFVSIQSATGEVLCERIGPVTLHMRLSSDASGLFLSMLGARCLGVSVPALLLPRIQTREDEADGRYRFHVEASMRGIGLVVRYRGWLDRAAR